MFFQLSLPSTAPGTKTGDEPASLETQGPDTLTLPAVRTTGRPVARIRVAPARRARGSLHVGIAASCVPITYTAERAGVPGPDLPLQ